MSDKTPKPEWYVIHTYSGYENKVAQSIVKKAENQQLTDKILEVQIPTEQVREITDGKEQEITRKIFLEGAYPVGSVGRLNILDEAGRESQAEEFARLVNEGRTLKF